MIRIWALAGLAWLEVARRKDIYVLFLLVASLLAGVVSLDIFGLGGMAGYVKDAGLMAAWILGWILAVGTAVRQLTQEEARGTVFVLLSKPVSRLEVVLGKWLGAWLMVTAVVGCFYLAVWLAAVLKGGAFDWVCIVQAFLLHGMAIGLVAAIGVAFSTRLGADAAATLTYLVTGAAFLILPRVPSFLVDDQGGSGVVMQVMYYLLPHFELFDLRRRMVHEWGPADWGVVTSLMLYGVLWIAAVLSLAWAGYRHRRFSRGSLL